MHEIKVVTIASDDFNLCRSSNAKNEYALVPKQ